MQQKTQRRKAKKAREIGPDRKPAAKLLGKITDVMRISGAMTVINHAVFLGIVFPVVISVLHSHRDNVTECINTDFASDGLTARVDQERATRRQAELIDLLNAETLPLRYMLRIKASGNVINVSEALDQAHPGAPADQGHRPTSGANHRQSPRARHWSPSRWRAGHRSRSSRSFYR